MYPFRYNQSLNRSVATAPTIFRLIHDLQAKVFPESKANLAQADAGTVRKGHRGQEKMAEAARNLETKYRTGEISAQELLREAAIQSTNADFRQMLMDAAVADQEAEAQAEQANRFDPVMDFTEDMLSDDGSEGEEALVDSEDEQEAGEIRARSHQWQVVDWPEVVAPQGEERVQLNRVRPDEDVDRVVVSVCTVCADHYPFHYVLANCSHQVCRSCFFQIDTCPECRAERGTLEQAKKVSNKPSLIRADAEGRLENRILTQRQHNNKLFWEPSH